MTRRKSGRYPTRGEWARLWDGVGRAMLCRGLVQLPDDRPRPDEVVHGEVVHAEVDHISMAGREYSSLVASWIRTEGGYTRVGIAHGGVCRVVTRWVTVDHLVHLARQARARGVTLDQAVDAAPVSPIHRAVVWLAHQAGEAPPRRRPELSPEVLADLELIYDEASLN